MVTVSITFLVTLLVGSTGKNALEGDKRERPRSRQSHSIFPAREMSSLLSLILFILSPRSLHSQRAKFSSTANLKVHRLYKHLFFSGPTPSFYLCHSASYVLVSANKTRISIWQQNRPGDWLKARGRVRTKDGNGSSISGSI